MNYIEVISCLFILISVVLASKQNVYTWVTGIVGTLGFIYLFYTSHIYFQLILQVIFLIQGVWGYVYWKKENIEIKKADKFICDMAMILIPLGSYLLFLVLALFHKEVSPLDITITAWSLLANYLLIKKKLEAWLFWIAVDICSVALFADEKLYYTAGLYFIFLIIAIYSYIKWKKELSGKVVLS